MIEGIQTVMLLVAGVLVIGFLAGMVINTWLDVLPKLERRWEARKARRLWKDP